MGDVLSLSRARVIASVFGSFRIDDARRESLAVGRPEMTGRKGNSTYGWTDWWVELWTSARTVELTSLFASTPPPPILFLSPHHQYCSFLPFFFLLRLLVSAHTRNASFPLLFSAVKLQHTTHVSSNLTNATVNSHSPSAHGEKKKTLQKSLFWLAALEKIKRPRPVYYKTPVFLFGEREKGEGGSPNFNRSLCWSHKRPGGCRWTGKGSQLTLIDL